MPSPKPRKSTPGGESCERQVVVTPRSSRNDVMVEPDGAIAVRVTAPPAEGAGNKAVLTVLSDALSLPRSRIEIVRGASSRQKLVRFEITGDELNRRLERLRPSKSDATS